MSKKSKGKAEKESQNVNNIKDQFRWVRKLN